MNTQHPGPSARAVASAQWLAQPMGLGVHPQL